MDINLCFITLLGLMGRIVKGCVREVSLAQILLLCPHQWVRGRWPWGYGSALLLCTHKWLI